MLTKIVFGIIMVLIGIVLIIFDKVLIKGIGIVKIKKQEESKVEFFILRLIVWVIGVSWIIAGVARLYSTI